MDKPIVMRDGDGNIRCQRCLSLPPDAETVTMLEELAAQCKPGLASVWFCQACVDHDKLTKNATGTA